MHSSPAAATLVARARSGERRSGLEVVVTPSAVGRARDWAAGQLAFANPALPGDLIDDAVLAVSELVTNAIVAVATPAVMPGRRAAVSLVISSREHSVRIEVTDSSPAPLPAEKRESGPHDETGRGLSVIDALASHWGWRPDGIGKVVWCELASSLNPG
jgi:anti-sigma regulatory factor (Ser/Thr protein kinase)